MNTKILFLFFLHFSTLIIAVPSSILFVGNSFTLGGNVPKLVKGLAESAHNVTVDVKDVSQNGLHLSDHIKNATSLKALDEKHWDAVVFQEFSCLPTEYLGSPIFGNPTQFKKDATWLYERVKKANPNIEVVFYETWGRGADFGWYLFFSNGTTPGAGYFLDFFDMQKQLRFHYYDIAKQLQAKVAPAGDLWEKNFKTGNLKLHADDFYHANDAGAYLNALAIYSALYSWPSEGSKFYGALTEKEARYLQSLL